MKKLILTEEQYKLLEYYINEISSGFSGKLDKGGTIEVIRNGSTNKYTINNIFGNGQYVEASDKYVNFIFDLAKAFDKNKNTFTALKDGRFVAAQINPKTNKIISPQGIKGGSVIKDSGIKQIKIYDAYGELVDTVYSSLGDEERMKGQDKEKEVRSDLEKEKAKKERMAARDERIRKLVLSDPELERAMSYQPTFFKGLINLGRRKGVAVAMDRIEKYIRDIKRGKDNKDSKDKDEFNEFKVNSKVSFEIINKPIYLSYLSDKLVMNVDTQYEGRYVGKQYITGKGFKIYLKQKEGEDIYSGTIKAFFKDKDSEKGVVSKVVDKMDNVIIKIKDYNYG